MHKHDNESGCMDWSAFEDNLKSIRINHIHCFLLNDHDFYCLILKFKCFQTIIVRWLSNNCKLNQHQRVFDKLMCTIICDWWIKNENSINFCVYSEMWDSGDINKILRREYSLIQNDRNMEKCICWSIH